MHCPNCKQPELHQKALRGSGVVVDFCSKCHGVWFDSNELNLVLDVACQELQVPNDAKLTKLPCPKCQLPLSAFKYPQTYVEVDMCGRCLGLWLNSGEFKEIKIVRTALEKKGELNKYAPVNGMKGDLLKWVNSAIASLSKFD